MRSLNTVSGRIQRVVAKVSRTEKRVNAVITTTQPTVNSVGTAAIAPNAVTSEELGHINEIVADYKMDLVVGEGGYVTLDGGNYSSDEPYILGTDVDNNILQLPLPVRYGVVDSGYGSGQARVRLDGEDGLSGPYNYISGYSPSANDRVVLLWDYVGTYVISGKLLP